MEGEAWEILLQVAIHAMQMNTQRTVPDKKSQILVMSCPRTGG